MEVKDITEILKGREHKAINSQDTINILNYLKDKGVEEIVAKYKLDLFKYPLFGHAKEPIEELISVIKNHIYDGTGNVRYDGKKCTINLEGPPEKVFWGICTCRDKIEIIIEKIN